MTPPYPPGIHPPTGTDGTARTFTLPDSGTLPRPEPEALTPYVPTTDDPWDYAHAAHLLRRAMIGPRHREILEAVERGVEGTIDLLFTPFTPDYTMVADLADQDPIVTPFGPEDTPEGQRYRTYIMESRVLLGCWWLRQMVESPVSLQERMVYFWHNHFVTSVETVIFAEQMLVQNDLFRGSAWGEFHWLVWEVTINPAMLVYLGGVANIRTLNENLINENYARELLEIFTMGVFDREGRANYTQKDVVEGARALTGWQIPYSTDDDTRVRRYSHLDRDRHDWGPKEYMGESGNFDAFDIINIIFSRRAEQTAHFLCTKLYRNFVSEDIDEAVVEAMASMLKSSGWRVEVPLRALLRSRHFFDVRNRGVLVRSTHDLWLGLIRILGATRVPDFMERPWEAPPHTRLYERLWGVRHLPFFPPDVKGWPGGHTWCTSSSAIHRLQFASDLVMGRLTLSTGAPLYTFDVVEWARGFEQPNLRLLVRSIAHLLLASPPTDTEESYLVDVTLQGGGLSEWDLDNPEQKPAERLRSLLDAIVQLPRFQLY